MRFMKTRSRLCLILGLLLTLSAGLVAFAQSIQAGKVHNAKVKYVATDTLKSYPLPVIGYHSPGIAGEARRREILDKVVYPIINNSDKPIAAIILEFYRNKPYFGLEVYWHNGNFTQILISTGKKGKIDTNAYKEVLEVPRT